jgi:Outer membrane protein beta-barrel domain
MVNNYPMKLRSLTLVLFLLAMSATLAHAQRSYKKYRYFTVEGMIGASQYGGDISTPKDGGESTFPQSQIATLPTTQLGLALGVAYQFHPHLSAKVNAMFTRLQGDDQFVDGNPNQFRKLNFKSYVFEASAQLRYHFVSHQRNWKFRPKVDPYVFAGVGVFYYDPYVIFENRGNAPGVAASVGEKVFLRGLGTEGEPNAYNTVAISIPFGFGVKYAVNQKINIGLEFGLRATTTDYLDDVSGIPSITRPKYGTYFDGVFSSPLAAALANPGNVAVGETGDRRGNPETNDWYAFSGITVGYILGSTDQKCPKPRKGNKKKYIFF